VLPRLCAIVTEAFGLVSFVAAQVTRRTSVQALARGAGLAVYTFKRRFRAVTGESPATWLRRRRLERARLLLESSQLSVAEIAFEVGFSSISHFGYRFRQEYGTPPQAFRKAFGVSHEQPDSDED
jgi:transcriptional regulator GlxA family with amidase domain